MVKIAVNNVMQDEEQVSFLLSLAITGLQQAKSLAGAKPVEGFSHTNATFVPNNLGTRNPLLAAVYWAFSQHLPLRLTPDAIWNTIMQGVSTHVSQDPEKHRHTFVSHKGKETLSQDPEKHRHTFVSHKGKETLEVRDGTLLRGSPANDWGNICCSFVDKIAAKLSGKAALQALETNFTTTDATARVAHAIMFMDVVKSCFEYRVVSLCGIPSVELTGTKEDWSRMRSALALLDELDLSPWRARLDGILVHFENAFDNKIEQSFWNEVFLKHGSFGSGGVITISGWIGELFLYVDNEVNPVAMGESEVRLDPVDFPSGLSETPFTWEYFHEEIGMLLRGGLVGVVIDPLSKTVTPQLGWLVTEAADDLALKQQRYIDLGL